MRFKEFNRYKFDEKFFDVFDYVLKYEKLPPLNSNQKRTFKKKLGLLSYENGKLYVTVSNKTHNRRKLKLELIRPNEKIKVIDKLYSNPKTSRNGIESFYQQVTLRYANISRREVEKYLKGKRNYQRNFKQPRQKVVKPVVSKVIGQRVMIDLVDMSAYKIPRNKQTAYLLTFIDTFSKFLIVKPITQKTATKVLKAFMECVEEFESVSKRKIKLLHSDNGKEFINNAFKEYTKEKGIKHYLGRSYTPQDQGIIERANQTIKRMIFAYTTKQKDQGVKYWMKYINVLDKIVECYNTSIHKSTKRKPLEMIKSNSKHKKQVELVNKKLEKWDKNRIVLPKIKIGDKVRISVTTSSQQRKKDKFGKNLYRPEWGIEIFKIVKILKDKYYIEDGRSFKRNNILKVNV